MSNSQNKKNEQQNNLCTTLTEKLKKGELEEGFYYFKMPDGAIEIASEYRLIRYNLTKDNDKIEVLAPVPAYEEWQQLHKFLEEFNALDVAKENQRLQMSLRMTVDDYKNVVDICEQLKELLDKASHYLIRYKNNDTLPERAFYEEEVIEFLDKIDNAIGEK